jgi:hypothetical protein
MVKYIFHHTFFVSQMRPHAMHVHSITGVRGQLVLGRLAILSFEGLWGYGKRSPECAADRCRQLPPVNQLNISILMKCPPADAALSLLSAVVPTELNARVARPLKV